MRVLHASPALHRESAVDLLQRYRLVREASVSLIEPLEAEDCQIQTIPEVSPAKWHLAHTTWFFERFCLQACDQHYRVVNEHYHYLFNSYYYTVGEMHRRADRGILSRPLLSEVLEYRSRVDDAICELLALSGDDADLAFVLTLGLHHEQQHQELLLTDIKHVFFSNPLHPIYSSAREARVGAAMPHRFLARPSGTFEIGSAGNSFCFDNETPRHAAIVGPHEIGNRLVTNGEFAEFIASGAYAEPRLWLADAWSLLQEKRWNRPMYWSEDGRSEFTLGGWRELEPAEPVAHISFYEADAYARWANARLPSEAEWEHAAADVEVTGNLLDTGILHPLGASGDEAATPQQLFGDVWEWTASPYAPYPGFKPLAGSLGEYNGKFMSSQMVVRGGSCATWATHMRATYRSFFYPHDRWQFLGLRLARDAQV